MEDVTNEAVDAPTGTKEAPRIVMFWAVQCGWKIRVRDGTRAFLQSDTRKEDEPVIIIRPPSQAGLQKHTLGGSC